MISLRFRPRLFIFGCLYLAAVGGIAYSLISARVESMDLQGVLQFIFAVFIPQYAVFGALALAVLFPGLMMLVFSLLPRIKILPWL